MKKVVSVILVGCMIMSLIGCSGNNNVSSTKTPQATEKSTEQPQTTSTPVPTVAPEPVSDPDNLMPAGDFVKQDSHWGMYMESGGVGEMGVNSKEQLEVKIKNNGNKKHAVQVYCDGFELLQNAKYKLTFDMCSSVDRSIDWRVQINGSDYHAYAGVEDIKITTEMKNYEFEFTMEESSDQTPRFCFNMGLHEQDGELDDHIVTIDNVRLVVLDDSNAVAVDKSSKEIAINLNQVGYRPDDVKKAIFRNSTADTEFEVVKADSKESVFSGKITETKESASAGETVAYGDFSELKTPGTYIVVAKNSGESSPFVIGDDVYTNVFNDTVKMLYLQRCGSELKKENAGDFAHPACHMEQATIYGTSEKKDVTGGWHDAGDYGRYVVSGAKTVADLLLAYEEYSEAFGDDSGIPESGNKVPDVLDEARYELEWLLKMQDSKSGGVYHKVTGAIFEGNSVMPNEVTDEQLIMPISNCATGDFSAVMAMASRVYKKQDAGFAKTCLAASKKALDYLEKNITNGGYQDPDDVTTGEYPDADCKDEYFWALNELYKTTGDASYQTKLSNASLDALKNGFGWQSVTSYGMYEYLTLDKQDAALAEKMKTKFMTAVETITENISTDGYNSSMGETYPWGSNMSVANNGMILLMANKLFPEKTEYKLLAKQQLDYLLGANATSYCFITGYGTITPQSVHHRPSTAVGTTMKGMLVGGPNSNLEDPYAKQVLADKPAAKCYADSSQSFSCNEITIYWNSPFIYLLAGIQAK